MYDQFLKNLKILPLLVIVASLSFAIRLGELAVKPESTLASLGSAVAQDNETLLAPETSELANQKINSETNPPAEEEIQPPPVNWQDSDETDIEFSSIKAELFETLVKRRKDLDKRESAVEHKEALLKAVEQELDLKYEELEKIQREIQALLHQQSEEEQEQIASLVKVYEGMKSKEAATIFNMLDMDILIDVANQMSERKLAPIIAKMSPDRARTITIFLAKQKSLPTPLDQNLNQ